MLRSVPSVVWHPLAASAIMKPWALFLSASDWEVTG